MLRFIMRRNLPAGLFVVFERPDDALYVVFVDFFRGFRVSLYKQLPAGFAATYPLRAR